MVPLHILRQNNLQQQQQQQHPPVSASLPSKLLKSVLKKIQLP
jgi:hypothetical protein